MKTFKEFIDEKRGLGEVDPMPVDVLVRMTRIAADENLKQMLEFFQHLAKRNPKIKEELDNYFRDSNGLAKNYKRDEMDKQIVVTPTADSPYASE